MRLYTHLIAGLLTAAIFILTGCGQKSESDTKTAAPVVPASAPPKVLHSTPIAGSGKSANVSVSFHDDAGVGDLVDLFLVINTAKRGVDGTEGCAVWCRRTNNDIYLLSDAGNAWLGPRKLRSQGTLTNTQCTLNLPDTQINEVNGNAQWDVSVVFTPKFAGPKNVFAKAVNQQKQESNFDLLGAWNITNK